MKSVKGWVQGIMVCALFLLLAGSAFGNTRSSQDPNLDEFLKEIDQTNHPTAAQLEARELAGIPVARNSEMPVNIPLEPGSATQNVKTEAPPVIEEPPAILESSPEPEKETPPSEEDDE